MNFILFPLQIIVYFTDCIFFTDFSSGFQITVSLKCCPFFLITEYADIPNLVFNFLKYCRRPRTLLIRPSVRPSVTPAVSGVHGAEISSVPRTPYVLNICCMSYRTLDRRNTLPYIPIRVLHQTKLQTLFTVSSYHCHLAR